MEKTQKRNKKQKLHEGKSYGICTVCKREYKLKRKTKHNHMKHPKGICGECGTKGGKNGFIRQKKSG